MALLAIIDATPGLWPPPAPGAAVEGPADDADDTPWLLEIADYLERLWGLRLGLTAESLRGLTSEEQALHLLAGLKDTPFGAKAGPDSLPETRPRTPASSAPGARCPRHRSPSKPFREITSAPLPSRTSGRWPSACGAVSKREGLSC